MKSIFLDINKERSVNNGAFYAKEYANLFSVEEFEKHQLTNDIIWIKMKKELVTEDLHKKFLLFSGCGEFLQLVLMKNFMNLMTKEKFNKLIKDDDIIFQKMIFREELVNDNFLLNIFDNKNIAREEEVDIGDIIYIYNTPYYKKKHPLGDDSGFNLICVGKKNNENTYLGFSNNILEPKTYKEIKDLLFSSAEKDLDSLELDLGCFPECSDIKIPEYEKLRYFKDNSVLLMKFIPKRMELLLSSKNEIEFQKNIKIIQHQYTSNVLNKHLNLNLQLYDIEPEEVYEKKLPSEEFNEKKFTSKESNEKKLPSKEFKAASPNNYR